MSVSYLLGGALAVYGLLIIAINYIRQISNFTNKNKEDYQWSSPKPIIGPLCLILGYFILPVEFSKWIFWVLLLDPDTLMIIISIPYLLVRKKD